MKENEFSGKLAVIENFIFVQIIFPAEKKPGGRRQAGAGAHGLVVHLL